MAVAQGSTTTAATVSGPSAMIVASMAWTQARCRLALPKSQRWQAPAGTVRPQSSPPS
jgi:hypothetical protein